MSSAAASPACLPATAVAPDGSAPDQQGRLQAFMATLQHAMAQAAQSCAQMAKKSTNSQSGFVGVTKHKRTQRYEAHAWVDKKQVYLGAYDVPEQAACAADVLTLRRQRPSDLNFPPSMYEELQPLALQLPQGEMVACLRTFSKSLGRAAAPAKPARPASGAARGGGGASGSKQPAARMAGSPGRGAGGGQRPAAAGGQELTPRVVFSPAGALPASGRKPSSKRKAPTPTASVTDLESLGRLLEQRQQRQAQAAAQAVAAEAAAAAASPPVKWPHASQAAGRQGTGAGVARTPAPLAPALLRGTPGAQTGGASTSTSGSSAWEPLPGLQEQASGGLRPKARCMRRPPAEPARGQGNLLPGVLLVPALPPPRPLEAAQPVLLWPHHMLSVHELLAPLLVAHEMHQQQQQQQQQHEQQQQQQQQAMPASPAAHAATSALQASSGAAVLDVDRIQLASAALQALAGGGGGGAAAGGRG